MVDFQADNEHIKSIGRTEFDGNIFWMGFSGSGAAFTVTAKKLEITFAGDSGASGSRIEGKTDLARVAVYVNGVRIVDQLLRKQLQTVTVLESDTEQTADIVILKLSEAAMSLAGIKNISADTEAVIVPAPVKAHRIEFIGDSITCGYGVDDENMLHHFSTATEDVTKSYAYKTAQNLNADYSMVSISGYGIISGYTITGNEKIIQKTLPQYYTKFGFSNNTFNNKSADAVSWNFSRFIPEVIIINLGTNDDSYCLGKSDREDDFSSQYVSFLKTVRAYNPDAYIICTLGIMGDRLYPAIEKAAAQYTSFTGDDNISTFHFTPQILSDGYAAAFHPTERTYTKEAAALTTEIKRVLNW